MEEFLDLAEQSGMSREKGKHVAGGLFALLKEHSPEEYQKVTEKIPEADDLVQKHHDDNETESRDAGEEPNSRGILGKLFGGSSSSSSKPEMSEGGMSYLKKSMKKYGVTALELIVFIPLALWFLKRVFGIDIFHLFGGKKKVEEDANNHQSSSSTSGGKQDTYENTDSGTNAYANESYGNEGVSNESTGYSSGNKYGNEGEGYSGTNESTGYSSGNKYGNEGGGFGGTTESTGYSGNDGGGYSGTNESTGYSSGNKYGNEGGGFGGTTESTGYGGNDGGFSGTNKYGDDAYGSSGNKYESEDAYKPSYSESNNTDTY